MLINLRELDDHPTLTADVCIVGAGAAGLTLASELNGSGFRVCLVESGGLEIDGETQLLSEVENVGLPRLEAMSRRLRTYGGTTLMWAGKCGRLDPMDFEVRDWVPNSGWPISRQDLDPYYDRAEPVLDIGPTRTGEDIARHFRVPVPTLDGQRVQLHAWQMSPPTLFGSKYAWIAEQGSRVEVLIYANAVNIQTSANGAHVLHLDVRSLNGRQARIRARTFVLACGGIENARLLLASNKVDWRGIGNTHDLVGRYFMEHLRARHVLTLDRDPYVIQRIYNLYRAGDKTYMLGLSLTAGAQRAERVLNGAFMPNYDVGEDSATELASQLSRGLLKGRLPEDVRGSTLRVLRNLDEIIVNLRRKVHRRGSGNLTRDAAILVIETEQCPNHNSRISLSTERDPLGQYKAKVDWRFNELDQKSMMTTISSVASQLWSSHRVRVLLPLSMQNPLDRWGYNFVDVSHHIGTTRMASDPSRGVVDANCRVHGLDNLYLAGSSVFPTGGQVNPTMTIVALALRLADRLKIDTPRIGLG